MPHALTSDRREHASGFWASMARLSRASRKPSLSSLNQATIPLDPGSNNTLTYPAFEHRYRVREEQENLLRARDSGQTQSAQRALIYLSGITYLS